MKIAICQINPVIGDFKKNLLLINDAVEHAYQAGCNLAVFPEMSLLGYPPKDLLEKPALIDENLRKLNELASINKDINILCGYVERNPLKIGKPLINGVALINNGQILKRGGKRLLPTYDVYDESRYFEPALKSLVFELEDKKLGVTICEDIWSDFSFSDGKLYDLDPVADLASQNIDILINLSASAFYLGIGPQRLKILKKITKTHKFPAIYCNQVCGNDDLIFDGSSMVVDQDGKLILLGKQFETDLIIWETDKEYTEILNPWPTDEETVLEGLILGTRDYTTRCGFKKVLVGLSGGIDSTLVAVIASRALGPENVMGISMPSPYTSKMSKDDARKLASNLGILFEKIPIQELFQLYKDSLKHLFKSLKEDKTEENIQARIRGNLLMALSNKFNALLLTTGNKSEMAMGYCTLYGDMSGGLAVISDIPKTMCYRLANHINHKKEIIPQRIITRLPSAELRPNQTDQDTLPPYEILDDILKKAIEENMGVDKIVAKGHDPAIVKEVIHCVVVNEYKRRQAPTGLKITSKAFGYGRRYPIARGKDTF